MTWVIEVMEIKAADLTGSQIFRHIPTIIIFAMPVYIANMIIVGQMQWCLKFLAIFYYKSQQIRISKDLVKTFFLIVVELHKVWLRLYDWIFAWILCVLNSSVVNYQGCCNEILFLLFQLRWWNVMTENSGPEKSNIDGNTLLIPKSCRDNVQEHDNFRHGLEDKRYKMISTITRLIPKPYALY